jgi:RNA polymerase sigma-70 factor (ECF subfamily)
LQESKSQESLFTEYLESYKKLIFKVARAYCNDEEDRKDLVQDIILQLWKSYAKYDSSYAISTWTYRIAINVSISFLRKKTSRKKTHTSYQQESNLMLVNDPLIDEKLDQLYLFINLLKPIDKALIILYLEGCKNKEISTIMGMSESNVSTKKQRIIAELKKYFKPNNYK